MFKIFVCLLICWVSVAPVNSCTPTQSSAIQTYAAQGSPGLNGLNVNPGAIGNARSPIYGGSSLSGTVGTLNTTGIYGRRRRSVEDSFAHIIFEFGDVTDTVEAAKMIEISEQEYSVRML